MQVGLKDPYPGIERSSGATFGGSQRMLKSAVLQRCGCAVIAAVDMVRYLHLYHSFGHTLFFTGISQAVHLPLAVYDLCAMRMQRNFMPVLYPVGVTIFSLTAGLNRYFRKYHVPLEASWGTAKRELWSEIENMLQENLPVILAIGRPVTGLWTDEGLPLYRYKGNQMVKATCVKAHYVSVVAISDHWMKIATWGQDYYISRSEFSAYRDRKSLNLLCNIVRLRHVEITECG